MKHPPTTSKEKSDPYTNNNIYISGADQGGGCGYGVGGGRPFAHPPEQNA